MQTVGRIGSHVLFSNEENAVVIDTHSNAIVSSGKLRSYLVDKVWEQTEDVSKTTEDLARASLTSLDISVVAAGGRLYTIPKGATIEAEKALAWHKKFHRGGTPVGLNTARTLARGGQIGIEKVRHIAKYFPRHEVDKKADGYRPGEKGFPSNGRIAWALWGGDTAWKWAQQIVERENNKALKSDGFVDSSYSDDELTYSDSSYDADLSSFEENSSYEFIARMRMDGSGIDRLYRVGEDLSVAVWDDGFWCSLPGIPNDLASYDVELDADLTSVEFSHVEIDNESALFLSACFQENPYAKVSLFDVNFDEAVMMLNAAEELDLEFIDRVLIAAGTGPTPTSETGGPQGDGQYTPEERSKNAAQQVRDKTGRFSKSGSKVVIAGDTQRGSGTVVGMNPQAKTLRIKLENGAEVDVPGNVVEPAGNVTTVTQGVKDVAPLDTTGILGEPRVPIDRPNAKIPGTLPRFAPQDVAAVLYDFPSHVQAMRDEYNKTAPMSDVVDALKKKVGEMPATKTPKIITGKDQLPTVKKTQALLDLEKLTGTKLEVDPYKDPRDRKSTRLNSSHTDISRMPSSA